MIDRTFIHLPGIGRTREQMLWNCGVSSWEVFEDALRSGVPPRGLFSPKNNFQLSLFTGQSTLQSATGDAERYIESDDPRVNSWLDSIDQSRQALLDEDYGFFLERLNPGEHWRVLAGHIEDALYLDIETTGLSID